jgi:hypothetical protein
MPPSVTRTDLHRSDQRLAEVHARRHFPSSALRAERLLDSTATGLTGERPAASAGEGRNGPRMLRALRSRSNLRVHFSPLAWSAYLHPRLYLGPLLPSDSSLLPPAILPHRISESAAQTHTRRGGPRHLPIRPLPSSSLLSAARFRLGPTSLAAAPALALPLRSPRVPAPHSLWLPPPRRQHWTGWRS